MVRETPSGLLEAGVTQLATIAWRTFAFLAVTMYKLLAKRPKALERSLSYQTSSEILEKSKLLGVAPLLVSRIATDIIQYLFHLRRCWKWHLRSQKMFRMKSTKQKQQHLPLFDEEMQGNKGLQERKNLTKQTNCPPNHVHYRWFLSRIPSHVPGPQELYKWSLHMGPPFVNDRK